MKNTLLTFLLGLLIGARASTAVAVTNTVSIGNYFFNPTNITINVGDTIRWTNAALPGITHDSTRTNSPFTWASPDLDGTPTTFFLTFSNAGTYSYFCERHVYAGLPQNRHPEQTGTVSVVSMNLAPSVSLTNPVNNARFAAPANIQLQASASDDGSVTNVQFFSGAILLGNDAAAPYAFTVNNAVAGNYSFTARAVDNTGLAATSSVVSVSVLTNAVLSAPARLPNGQSWMSVQGIVGQTYALEGSTNLANWTGIITNVAPANTFNITDSTSTNILQRFYRTRQNL